MSKIQVDTIDTRSGTSTMQIGSTNTSTINLGVSGDTINIPSGVTIANAGTATGFAAMTPAFEATLSGNQTVTDENNVKIQFNTEVFDIGSCYDNSSNYRFTPTTAGKYFVYTMIGCNSGSDSQLHTMNCRIYKNGSAYANSHFDFRTNYARFATGTTTATIDFNGSSDYVEAYVYIDDGSGDGNVQSGEYSRFGAYRILT